MVEEPVEYERWRKSAVFERDGEKSTRVVKSA